MVVSRPRGVKAMPIHDWTRVDAGLFHDFHQSWITRLRDTLNGGLLPPDYFALAEQTIRGPIPDILTLRLSGEAEESTGPPRGLAVAAAPPRARVVQRREEEKAYARKADRISVRHRSGEIVAVLEIVSPGNKSSTSALRAFVEKTSDLIERGVHALVIDLHPPTKRDPQGIHAEIWDQLGANDFELPADKPLVLAGYDAGPLCVAYVMPVAVGDILPDMPLFLRPEFYVPVPLESTYQANWSHFPAPMKRLLEAPPDRS
jgi:hypothetical protein